MAKKEKKRFYFSSREDLLKGIEDDDVRNLQSILSTFGYLRSTYDPGRFDTPTERAVRRYQRFYNLEPDGVVGDVTKNHMQRPRCGVADIPTSPMGTMTSAPFVLRGCKYDRHDLTYAFLNSTTDLPVGRQQEIIRQAFEAWSAVADLRFTEVGPNEAPDFPIAWHEGDHGDGSPFDGLGGPQSNTLAHAFYPGACGGQHAGSMHFDNAETWIDDPTQSGIMLLQVAIHEIGHLLGLAHSDDEAAIMFAFYAPDRVDLAQDDIDGITELYGAPNAFPRLPLVGQVDGTLGDTNREDIYAMGSSNDVQLSLQGPADVDFDLYVRRNEVPTTNDFEFRAFSASADERLQIPASPADQYFVMVRSFRGAGDYTLSVDPIAA